MFEGRASGALALNLSVELGFALGRPFARGKTLARRTGKGVFEGRLCGREPAFEIGTARRGLRQLLVQLRLTQRDARDVGFGVGMAPLRLFALCDCLRE